MVVDGEVGVQGRRARRCATAADVGDSGGRSDGIRPVVHADIVTGGGQRDGDAAPEPAAGAGDQDDVIASDRWGGCGSARWISAAVVGEGVEQGRALAEPRSARGSNARGAPARENRVHSPWVRAPIHEPLVTRAWGESGPRVVESPVPSGCRRTRVAGAPAIHCQPSSMVRRCMAENPSGRSVSRAMMPFRPWVRGPGAGTRHPPRGYEGSMPEAGDDLVLALWLVIGPQPPPRLLPGRHPRGPWPDREGCPVSRRVLQRSRTTGIPSTSTSVTSPRPAATSNSVATSCTGVRCDASRSTSTEVGPLAHLDRPDHRHPSHERAGALDGGRAQHLVGARDVQGARWSAARAGRPGASPATCRGRSNSSSRRCPTRPAGRCPARPSTAGTAGEP